MPGVFGKSVQQTVENVEWTCVDRKEKDNDDGQISNQERSIHHERHVEGVGHWMRDIGTMNDLVRDAPVPPRGERVRLGDDPPDVLPYGCLCDHPHHYPHCLCLQTSEERRMKRMCNRVGLVSIVMGQIKWRGTSP